MGYSTERFVKPVDENLVCSICCGVFTYPVVTNCGHTFCFSCLDEWLRAPHQAAAAVTASGESFDEGDSESVSVIGHQCPACRHPLEDCTNMITLDSAVDSFGGSVTVARPVLALRNLIESLPMVCVYAARGCTSVKPVELMETGVHQSTCSYAPIDCVGCGTTVNRMELEVHQLNCPDVASRSEKNNTRQASAASSIVKVEKAIYNKATQTDKSERLFGLDRSNYDVWTKPCNFSEDDTSSVDSMLSTQDGGCITTNTRTSLVEMLHGREQESLEFLNLSLLKLVYALKVELECCQTELRRAQSQRKSANAERLQSSRKYM